MTNTAFLKLTVCFMFILLGLGIYYITSSAQNLSALSFKTYATSVFDNDIDLLKDLNYSHIREYNESGKNLLFYAQTPEMLNLLISKGFCPLQAIDKNGISLLELYCALEYPMPLIKELLKYGIDVNHRDNEGGNALLWAIGRKNISLVKVLLSHGAKASFSLKDGTSYLEYAKKINGENSKIVELLIEQLKKEKQIIDKML